VDIMREDGHTHLTAEQVHGMVAVVKLSRAIASSDAALKAASEGGDRA
jgi:hypothetical protein